MLYVTFIPWKPWPENFLLTIFSPSVAVLWWNFCVPHPGSWYSECTSICFMFSACTHNKIRPTMSFNIKLLSSFFNIISIRYTYQWTSNKIKFSSFSYSPLIPMKLLNLKGLMIQWFMQWSLYSICLPTKQRKLYTMF